MSKNAAKTWIRNLLKAGIAAFAGAIATGLGGGEIAHQIGHPVAWQAQLVMAATSAAVAVATYLKRQPLWDDDEVAEAAMEMENRS